MSLRPRDMPKLRTQTLHHLSVPGSRLRSGVGEVMQPGLDALENHLRVAELYWVAADMAALAVSAGEQLAAARWASADRSAPCGLLLFDGGVGSVNAHGVDIPIEACTWGPAVGGLLVWLLLSRRRLAREMAARAFPGELVEEEMPPLLPVAGYTLPVTDEPVPMAELETGVPVPVMQALAASWLLMQQPQLIDRTRERAEKSVRRAAVRQGLPDPEVTIVDLRRQYVPQDQDPDGEGPGRRYRHRWVVSGHWRNAWRPSVKEHRKVWVPAHVKGPQGAPMLKTERVNVWRR